MNSLYIGNADRGIWIKKNCLENIDLSNVSMFITPEWFFRDEIHYNRFKKVWSNYCDTFTDNTICAVILLLTSDTYLWNKIEKMIKPGIIDFSINIQGADLDAYILFITARDLYKGYGQISLRDLIDSDLISEFTFRMVVISLFIDRYGPAVIPVHFKDKYEY